ncbi:MAG TPA: hypothetical protein VMR98_03370, partial [Candidatus Polarisedimenticolaceae bacterium]|nr:hypothetical protein [Candidatus Polarisedimenticolaceae bacterium]
MKVINYIKQPHGAGIVLFGLAASVLLAIIGAGTFGLPLVAQLLNQVAQPVCAAAIGVLLYLALVTRR